MELKRYRQLIGLLVLLVIPIVAIAGLGWQVMEQQVNKERSGIAIKIGSDIRERLNRIMAQETAASGSADDSYSDPSVMFVGRVDDGKLIPLWESPEPSPEPFRRASMTLARIRDDSFALEYTKQQPEQAAEKLRGEIQDREGIERDYLRIQLAGVLRRWKGHEREAVEFRAGLLDIPSKEV